MGGPSLLFQPFSLRAVTIPNRIAVSPMCMYAAHDGFVSDYHLVHLGRFALGGAGLVIVEATAVSPEGRISHHDLGLWKDEHIPGLARIARFLESYGSVPGIQLGHAGRKASVTEPWLGGMPLGPSDAEHGTPPWPVIGPSAVAAGRGWPIPRELDHAGIDAVIAEWVSAAQRAVTAGFRLIELHGAHGYLLHSFLSPISNHRVDEFGGSPDARMEFPLRVVRAIRASIPTEIALSYRISVVDGVEGGLAIEDTIAFARQLAVEGVDIIDTSSGGIVADRSVDTRVRRGFAFHADFAHAIKRDVEIAVATVGLIVDGEQAELALEAGDADVVVLGRQMLDDPNWAHHARQSVDDPTYDQWHVEAASALEARRRTLSRLAGEGETPWTRYQKSRPGTI